MGSSVFRRDGGAGLLPVSVLRGRLFEEVAPVDETREEAFAAIGAVLADDIVVAHPFPPTSRAQCRGIALASVETVGASPYAPVTLDRAIDVEVGQALPAGCDAVLPHDAVTKEFGTVQISQTVAPWTNAVPAGSCVGASGVLARAGDRVDPILAHAATTFGLATLPVRRPKILIRHDGSPDAACAARTLAAVLTDTVSVLAPLDASSGERADLHLAIGVGDLETDDPAVAFLADRGSVEGFGVALSPDGAVAWGRIDGRPALVLPPRLDALISAVLVLVLPLVRRLTSAPTPSPLAAGALSRKIVSRIGLTEVALLAPCDDGRWQPLGVDRWSWPALLAARAWITLGPESEGCPEGTMITPATLNWCRPTTSGELP